ncbi:MAG: CRISPR-associated protein Cas4 [Candidatus Nanoarchaeia archaeon]
MENIMLTATDVMNYNYCPRIIFYVHVLKKPQITTKKEYKGREKFEEFKLKLKRSKIKNLSFEKLFNVKLVSEKLGLKTIADSIIINRKKRECYPVQAKFSIAPIKVYRTQRIQLLMEAILIEELTGFKVPFGYIKFLRSGDLLKIPLTAREDAYKTFKSIREIIIEENFPESTPYKKRCIDCCFKRFCWGD